MLAGLVDIYAMPHADVTAVTPALRTIAGILRALSDETTAVAASKLALPAAFRERGVALAKDADGGVAQLTIAAKAFCEASSQVRAICVAVMFSAH